MLRLKITVDSETLDALERRAQSERRRLDLQAEVMLRQALGLTFPFNEEPQSVKAPAARPLRDEALPLSGIVNKKKTGAKSSPGPAPLKS